MVNFRLLPRPLIHRGLPTDAIVFTTYVTVDDLDITEDQKELARAFSKQKTFLDYVSNRDEQLYAVWVEKVGEHQYRVMDQEENVFNLSAAIMRDQRRILVIMLSDGQAPNA